MKISFKKSAMFLLTLLVLIFSALGTTPAYATWVFNNKDTTNGLGSNTVNGVYVSGTTIYAATTNGLSISTDGGSSFSNITNDGITGLGNSNVKGVFFSGGTIYAATTSGLSISTNGGTTFVNRRVVPDGLGSNTVYGVFVSGSTVYAATDGGLSISTNGGGANSFSNRTTGDGLGSNTVYGVFASGSMVYAATTGGVSISTNGGTTFSNKTTSDGLVSNAVNGVFDSAGTIYAATDGGLAISTDGGSTFSNKTTGMASTVVKGVFVSGSAIYAATTGGLAISTNGGTTFSNKTTSNGLGSNQVRGGVFVSGTTAYTATQPNVGVGGGLSIGSDIDITAPTINSFTAPSSVANFNIPITAFTASDDFAVTGYMITESATPPSAGAGGWSGTAPTTYIVTSNGSYTLYPWAKDAAGNVSAVYGSPASVNVLDNTAPQTSIDSKPSNPNNDSTPDFTFSGNDGAGSGVASFMCQMDGGAYAACTSPFTSSALTDGSHTFNVKAADNAGNEDASPASYTWTLDTVAPDTTINSQPSNPNNDSTPDFTFSGNDGAGSGVASFMCKMDGGAYAACTSPFTSSTLADGSHTFSVKALDNAANQDASPASYTWTVDATGPNTSINSQPSNPNNNSTPDFTFSGNDGTGTGVASFMCQMDAGAYAACTSPFTSPALADGSHTFNVKAIDILGNEDPTPATYTWLLDTTGPNTTINSNPSDPNNDNTPGFTFSGNDGTGSGVSSFKCKMDAGSYTVCASPFTSPALADGSHTFTVKAIDNIANEDASPATYTWTVDTTSPNTTINSQPSNPNNDSTPDFTFSGNDGAGSGVASFMCKIDTGAYAICTSPFTSPALVDGLHTFNVKAIDNATNEDSTPASYTWTLDATAPDTTIDSKPSDPNNDSTPDFTFSGTDVSGSGVASFMCQMDGGSYATCTSPFTSSTLSDGSHTFNVKAIDNATNEDTTPASYTWVVDALAPSVSSIVRANPNPTSAASINFTVVFSKPVTGVDTNDFSLTTTGVSSNTVSGVSGSDATYTVTVTTGIGNGTIRLNVPNTASIVGVNGHSIAALPYTSGESYTVDKGLLTPPSIPVLVSPTNDQLITDYTPFFDWGNSSTNGSIFDHYQIQVATDAAFSSIVTDVNISGISNSFYTLPSDLASNTKYYWRVSAVNLAGGASNWSAVRFFRTIVSAATLLSPSNGFNALSLRPSFDWDDATGSGAITGYVIQISKNNTFTQIVHTGNPVTSSYIPTADMPKNLQLFWRVQTKGANGPSVWSEVRSFNSSNSPTTPVLSLPASNALNTNYTPLFKWSAVTLPAGTSFKYYQLQVADNVNFSSPVLDDNSITDRLITQFQIVTPLAHNTKFYWRVRAVNTDDEEGSWSAVGFFRAVVDAATLLSPNNGFNALTLRPSFDWDDASGPGAVISYTIQISNNNTFTQIAHTGNSVTSSYVPTADLPKNLPLFWRVMVNGANGPSAWSAVRSFNSANSPTTPVLSLPTSNFLNTDYVPLFKWSAATLPAGTTFKYYQLQVADNVNFSSPVLDDKSITDRLITQFQTVAPLAHNTKFYWRVRAVNTDDEEGGWSVVGYFRTIVDAANLITPSDGSDPLTMRPSFDWDDASGSGAVTYTIQISKNNTFTQIVYTGNLVTSNYIPTTDLPKNLPIFWRVQTKGANGPSAWSEVRSFFSANPPTTPALSLPASNTLNTNYTPLFKWNAVTLPAGTSFKYYQLQVADNVNFSSPVLDDNSITDRLITQFQIVAPLAHNTKFYWRVRAINTDDEEGSWSAVGFFRTIVDAPTLLLPANGTSVGSLLPLLDWNNASGPAAVTGYSIQISASPTFAILLVKSNTVNSAYTPLVNLPAHKIMYWRVRVNGANGPSVWSAAFSFTTP